MGPYPHRMALKAGSCATEGCEPRQVRKEATVSRSLRVLRECLAGAIPKDMPRGRFRRGVHGLVYSQFAVSMKHRPTSSLDRLAPEGPAEYQAPPRKALGQHYVVDRTVLPKIIAAAEVGPLDKVVEVGPGLGALTRHLVDSAHKVVAVEVDHRLAASLPRRLGNPANLQVINADAREIDLAQVLNGQAEYKLVANLPYYAATPIIRRFLEAGALRPSLCVVMVQREVAQRMVAQGGRMSILAVAIQVYGISRIICYVPPRAFYPAPKVTSAVVRIDCRPHPAIQAKDLGEFFEMVKAGHSAPRKQLRNSLSLGLGIAAGDALRLLERAGLDPRLRAQNLSVEDWWKLCQAGKVSAVHGNKGLRQD